MIKGFEYKCTCDWSKNDEFGFIPNTECPAHGKQTKETLSKCIPLPDSITTHTTSTKNNIHPTKQTVQTESGDVLSEDLKRSGGSTKVKTDDSKSKSDVEDS